MAEENKQATTQTEPQHIGGGWYLLPSGEKVKGEAKAYEAYEEWKKENEVTIMATSEDVAEGDFIQAVGPTDSKSGAEVLRLPRRDGRQPLDIRAGQLLKVGDQITEAEAVQLLNSRIWSFERVNINA